MRWEHWQLLFAIYIHYTDLILIQIQVKCLRYFFRSVFCMIFTSILLKMVCNSYWRFFLFLNPLHWSYSYSQSALMLSAPVFRSVFRIISACFFFFFGWKWFILLMKSLSYLSFHFTDSIPSQIWLLCLCYFCFTGSFRPITLLTENCM